jgi:hypothetical protein
MRKRPPRKLVRLQEKGGHFRPEDPLVHSSKMSIRLSGAT